MALFIDDRGGTGGGIFRYMYARFLDEAATITSEPRLAEMGADLEAIGDAWLTVAAAFAEAVETDNPAELLPAATEPMASIADREEDLWERLRAIVR